MPKRAAAAVALVTGALALLLAFKSPAEAPTDGSALAPSPATSADVDAPAAAADPAGASPSPSPTPTAGATAGPATAAYVDGTVVGPAIETRWGTVQVEATIADGRIVDVTAVELPAGDHHSAAISERVAPILRSAALEAQSAEIDTVSGATYTSTAYATSLQAALDQARA
jgi:uncharacterized protein with FMN-binding domain